mmetsp:Transcript_3270/g.7237  ORF Transcript_3270/g.7237 Transcript_3270/m.7237 type:complete len:242 (+) Transcript_3270:54-779(+)
MEEPPKIERIISLQGVTLSDTSTILTTYLADIDQYHHHPTAVDHYSPEHGTTTVTQEDQTPQSKRNGKFSDTPRKSRQEREEEALIAQMDRLVGEKLSSGMISDDVYERLKMISDSIRAEVEGRPWSASGVVAAAAASTVTQEELGDDDEQEVVEQNDDGADAFLAELEVAVKLERQGGDQPQQQQQQQPTPNKSKRDKKKEKKAKKAAKKAKKEAKRKSKEMEGAGDGDLTRASKRVKTE